MRLLAVLLTSILFTMAGETKLGAPLAVKSQTSIADLNARPMEFVGKTVLVKGKITEVCEKMGCWMMLVDPSSKTSVRIKVKDGEIVFPLTAVGKMALAEGKYAKIEMTKEQAVERARHEAEEMGRKFDPSTVKGPMTVYQIQGTGAIILE